MARHSIFVKLKGISCIFNSDVDNSVQALAQAILILKRLFDWFDWNSIEDVTFMPGDPIEPEGFIVKSSPVSHEDG